MLHSDTHGWTDKHDEANNRFSQTNACKNHSVNAVHRNNQHLSLKSHETLKNYTVGYMDKCRVFYVAAGGIRS